MYAKLLPEKSFVLGEFNQLFNFLSPANCKGCKMCVCVVRSCWIRFLYNSFLSQGSYQQLRSKQNLASNQLAVFAHATRECIFAFQGAKICISYEVNYP